MDNVQAAPAPTTVAGNISKAINERANGKPAPATPEPAAPTPAPVDPNAGKKRYVVDGNERWLTPEQAEAYVQKGMAFEPKVDQLNRLQSETAQLLKTLSTDPLKILTDKRIGLTPKIVMKKLFDSGMIDADVMEDLGKFYYENAVLKEKSPEEFAQMQRDKKLSTYEQQEKERAENALRQDNQRRVQAAMVQIKTQIAEAMKESGLPSNDTPLGAEMARMVAEEMRVSRGAATPKQAIEKVKYRIKEVQRAYYDTLEGEALVKELGDKNAEKVKQYLLKLVKAADKSPVEPQKVKLNGRPGERKTINSDDFHEAIQERIRNS